MFLDYSYQNYVIEYLGMSVKIHRNVNNKPIVKNNNVVKNHNTYVKPKSTKYIHIQTVEIIILSLGSEATISL